MGGKFNVAVLVLVLVSIVSAQNSFVPSGNCLWSGTAPFCGDGECKDGWMPTTTSAFGDGVTCWTGIKVFCCLNPQSGLGYQSGLGGPGIQGLQGQGGLGAPGLLGGQNFQGDLAYQGGQGLQGGLGY